MKTTFKLQKDIHFVCKNYFIKNLGIQLSGRLKNVMSENSQNTQKIDYCWAGANSFLSDF